MDIIYVLQREMLRRCYSTRTIHSYVHCISSFMNFCNKDLKKVTKLDIKNYLDKHIDKGNSGSTINVNLNAIKFVMEEILNKKLMLKFKYSKTPKSIPIFLAKEEVKKLFEATKNEKHKLILELIYSAGLRVSEVVNLKLCDLDFSRNMGWVRHGKGNKDRPFIIASLLKPRFFDFVSKNCDNQNSFIFSGRNGKLSVRSVQEIVKTSAKKANILKDIHPHSLRHSFATHLIEDGCDISSVQPLLGHNSAETTLMYVHAKNPSMLKVKSPYDSL